MKKKIGAGSIFLGICCVLGWVYFIAVIGSSIIQVGRCVERGCNNGRKANSQYCYTHDPFAEGARIYEENQRRLERQRYSESRFRASSNNTSSSNNSNSFSGSTNSSGGYNYSEKYNTHDSNWYPINDPEDYDDPEEYADDAWGEDFDDWDEAYDYWEDY